MSNLKKSPSIATPKQKSVKNITVSQSTDIHKAKSKTTTSQPTIVKPTKLNQIVIEKIIVHIVDPKMSGPTLSNDLLDLQIYTEAFDLVQKHIFNILRNKRTREAKFTNYGTTTVCGLAKTACTVPSKFIDASQKLAELLHTQMKKVPNTGECDLVACQYHIAKEPEENQKMLEEKQKEHKDRQLAILKFGMTYGLRNLVDPIGGTVNLENSKPFTFRELQKGALVLSCGESSPCNLLILDNQTKPLYQKSVAIYFREKYLKSEFISDSIYLTRLLYESLIDIENALFKAGKYPYVERIHKLEEYICTQNTYNLAAWMTVLKFPVDLKTQVKNLLHPNLKTVITFPIDSDIFLKYLEHARFRGSHELTLQVPGSSLSMIILPKVKVKPEKQKKPILITLKTNDWTRLK